MFEDKEIFIHVGLHKTASTFLQEKVFPKFKKIHLIANPQTQLNEAFNRLIYADDGFYYEDLVIKEINKIKCNRILISDETLSGQPLFFLSNNRTTIAKRLSSLFPDAKIILFIRGQKDILLSIYSQYLLYREGQKYLLELFRHPQFIEELGIYPYYLKTEAAKFGHYSIHGFSHLDSFNYYECIRLYKNTFKDVTVLCYEDLLYHPESVIGSLGKILNEKISGEEINFSEKINFGLSHNEFYKQLFYNKTRFLFRKKAISNIFYYLYRRIRLGENFELQENLFLDRIVEKYFADSNREVIKHFPETNMKEFPSHYKF